MRLRGASDAARYVARQEQEGYEWLRESYALGGGILRSERELAEVAVECASPGWDGHGAAAVKRETILEGRRFLASLPLGMPAPSVGAEPDGQVTFEWRGAAQRVLSVSMSADAELHYAALTGARRRYGSEPFFGEFPWVLWEIGGIAEGGGMSEREQAAVGMEELLARYVLYSKWVRSDQTVRADAFIPYPYPDLSVTRHVGLTEEEIWGLGEEVAGKRGLRLYGRADVAAGARYVGR